MNDKITVSREMLRKFLDEAVVTYSMTNAYIALRAVLEQQPQEPVAGWKLVPVEPTPEMWAAMPPYDGDYYSNPFNEDDFIRHYKAMLSAAPQPAQQPETLCDCKGRFYDRCESAWEPCCTLGNSAEHAVAVSNITTTTQQPEADKLLRNETLEEATAELRRLRAENEAMRAERNRNLDSIQVGNNIIQRIKDENEALRAALEQTGVEPVAKVIWPSASGLPSIEWLVKSSEISAEMLLFSGPQPAQQAVSKDRIREIFLSAGFEIKEGQTDLKPYVYEAAYALLNAAPQAQQPQLLTDEEIIGALNVADVTSAQTRDLFLSDARIIETAVLKKNGVLK